MNFFKKWYTYQKERFPILIYGSYVLAIVIAVFCYCSYLVQNKYTINNLIIIPMFIVAFLQFLMVRIVDEFKDYEEDCKYRPYRPVPRGLIKLSELKVLFVICLSLQYIITIVINPRSLIYLLLLWLFFVVMSKGFFIKKFLDKHILAEVMLDELLMPILVLYLSSFAFFINIKAMWKILILSYIISWIVEVARKVRCKDDEEKGVKTYTQVFGINKAMLLLSLLETVLAIIHGAILGKEYIILVIALYIISNIVNLLFAIKKNKKMAKITELTANMYILFCYLSIGLLIL